MYLTVQKNEICTSSAALREAQRGVPCGCRVFNRHLWAGIICVGCPYPLATAEHSITLYEPHGHTHKKVNDREVLVKQIEEVLSVGYPVPKNQRLGNTA